jgi:hypothetical protein
MKSTIVLITLKALSLMLLGLAWLILHRTLKTWIASAVRHHKPQQPRPKGGVKNRKRNTI